MANCMLAFPDWIMATSATATVAFTGGSWLAELPLTNLLRPELAYVARTHDVSLQSTQFTVDLGVVRDIRGVFIPRTNGSRACKYRISALDDGVDADTGWLDLYKEVYPLDSLYWGSPSLWDGKIPEEDVDLYPMPIVATFSDGPVSRYWLVEFDDTENEDEYFELPRILFTSGWQPRINMSWGATLVVDDPSLEQEAIGGGLFFASRPKRRVQRFNLSFLDDDDAMVWVNDMQRRLGTSGQLFFVHDTADEAHMHRRSFLCRMRTIGPLEYASFVNDTAPFELAEILA